ALYTTDYYCSVGILEDKIICDLDKTPDLSQRPPQNCPKCENPVYGHYCQGCALLREKFKEDLFASCVENEILQDSSGPSNDNSNVANALREPFVVNLDPGIFCHQCTCKLCENSAYYGYNCPLEVSIIPDPEPFNNHTIKELPPTVQSFDPKFDLVYNSPNLFSPSLQPLIHSYEFCGNDAYYGQDCSLQVSFDQSQPLHSLVIHQPPQEMSIQEIKDLKQQYLDEMKRLINSEYRDEIKIAELKENFNVTPSLSTEEPDNSLSMGDEHLDTIPATESDEFVKSSVENLIPIPSKSEGISDNMCDVPFHDNSPPFDASPPDYELVSSEVMEIVIPEVGGMDDDILLTIKDDILREKLLNINLLITKIEALNDNPTPSFDFMTKSSSTSLNSLLEETNTCDNSLPEFETFCFDVEEISSGCTTTNSDISLPEYEAFYDDHVKEISSGKYDCFFFKIKPNSGDFTMDVVEDISPTREPRVHNALPTHPTLQLNLEFNPSSESLFTYVVWTFLLIFSCSSVSSILKE
nr:hypothetical protein [Tanacetum cinerariifolium]